MKHRGSPIEEESQIMPKGGVVAYRCSFGGSMDTLVDRARLASGDRSFILLLRYKEGVCDRLLPSYLNAWIRKKESTMRSSSLHMEMLLFVAGTLNIKRAIEESAARHSNDFLLVSDDAGSATKFIKKNGIARAEQCQLALTFGTFRPVLD